jgi:hypothetical protein
LEVQERPQQVRLLKTGILFPVELDDLGVKHLAVMKGHALMQGDFQGALIEPPPAGRQARD